jgi:hypothetical protein
MSKMKYGIACMCMVIVGIEVSIIAMVAPCTKRYSGVEKVYSMKDMCKADLIAHTIEQNKFEEIHEEDQDLFKVLIRGHKDEAVIKLVTERHIMPNVDALEVALAYKRTELTLFFLDCVRSLALGQNRYGTLLHIASLYNNLQVAKKALEIGIGVDAVNQYQDTPLHVATCKGYQDMVVFLCDQGANPFKTTIRKFNCQYDAMDIAYWHMERMMKRSELSYEIPMRRQKYCDILHILYRYVSKFGGKVNFDYKVN